jgi:hypothetical protein
MSLSATPPLTELERRALLEALARDAIGMAFSVGACSTGWRRAALLEGVARNTAEEVTPALARSAPSPASRAAAPGSVVGGSPGGFRSAGSYALSPRSTRGATRA